MKKIIKKRIKIILPAVFVLFFSIFFYNLVFSKISDNISGYGWNAVWVDRDPDGIGPGLPNETQDLPSEKEGGMGWLSLNCTNPNGGGACDGSNDTGAHANYGLNLILPTGVIGTGLDTVTDALITGWAWSPNYGWLKFGGLAGFPEGPGTVTDDAKFNGTITYDENGEGQYDGTITGWARFCAPTQNPATCTDASGGFVQNDKNGDWDGWVSLSGDGYGVTVTPASTNSLLGNYAWGGDSGANSNFVGWISFEGGFIRNKNAGLNFSAIPNATSNGTTTLHWSIDSNILPNATLINCKSYSSGVDPAGEQEEIDIDPNSWKDGVIVDSELTQGNPGQKLVSVPYDPSWYKIVCSDENGNTYAKRTSVDIINPPADPVTVSLTASPISVPIGSTSVLTWESSLATSCVFTSNPPNSVWNTIPSNEVDGNRSITISAPIEPKEFTITCSRSGNDPDDSATASVTINGINPIKKPKYNEN